MAIQDRLVHLQIKDPAILIGGGLKASFGVRNPEGEHTVACCGCGQELRFTATLLNCTLVRAACGSDCKTKGFVWPELPKAEPVHKAVEPDLPDDDGDEPDIPDDEPKLRVVQPPKAAKPPCAGCGGPARGKGYAHQDVGGQPCPNAPKPKPASTETCPHCGGSKRGRGFAHQDGGGKPCPATSREPKPVNKAPRPHTKRLPPGALAE